MTKRNTKRNYPRNYLIEQENERKQRLIEEEAKRKGLFNFDYLTKIIKLLDV